MEKRKRNLIKKELKLSKNLYECGPFRVRARPCPRSVREVSEGRCLEVNFKLQCSYLHFFCGHFADRGVRGHEMELSQFILEMYKKFGAVKKKNDDE